MATTRRRKSLNLVEQIQSEPHRFDFFQAVRMLERAANAHPDEEDVVASSRVAGSARPDQEAIRFSSRPSLAFNGSDVTAVTRKRVRSNDEDGSGVLQWQMEVAMMGLTGSEGVMPHTFSEIVLSELKQKNHALKDYLDLFNHRTVSMYYESWHKYQMAPNYERAILSGSGKNDLFTDAVMSLAGIGLSEQRFRLSLPDERIAQYAGHFGRNICSAESLRNTIAGLFGFETSIEQFRGQWYDLPEDARCRMPDEDHPHGVNNALGVNTVMGSRCYQAQSKFCVVITPHTQEEFEALSPGSSTLEELKSVIRLSAGTEYDFEIEVKLDEEYLDLQDMFSPEKSSTQLGWSLYLNPDMIDAGSVSIRLSQDVQTPDDALPLSC